MRASVIRAKGRRLSHALGTLQEHIMRRYPDARFAVTDGEDPDGVHLNVLLDVDEPHELFDDAFCDLLLDLYGEDGLPLYVFANWPIERARKEIAKQLTLNSSAPASS